MISIILVDIGTPIPLNVIQTLSHESIREKLTANIETLDQTVRVALHRKDMNPTSGIDYFFYFYFLNKLLKDKFVELF